MRPKTLPILASLALAGFLLPAPVQASAVCEQIARDLVNVRDTASISQEVRKYANAIAAQKMNIRGLEQKLKDTHCSLGSLIIVGGPNAEECKTLEGSMDRMQNNLSILVDKRETLARVQPTGLERQRLITAEAENHCDAQPVISANQTANTSETASAETETISVPTSVPDYSERQFVDLGGAGMTGVYSTMCVRTCDGGYFQVSSHASYANFRRDAQVCSMMCPGTETELFFHTITEESADMRSAETGQPYDELKNAFRFRTRKPGQNSQCGCNFSLYYKEMMRRESFINNPQAGEVRQSSIVWVKPNLRGSIPDSKVETQLASAHPERQYRPDARIRVVGPVFLPDAGRIDFTKTIDGPK
jgi:hypothetical protein